MYLYICVNGFMCVNAGFESVGNGCEGWVIGGAMLSVVGYRRE